jgi:hypothetical protein
VGRISYGPLPYLAMMKMLGDAARSALLQAAPPG